MKGCKNEMTALVAYTNKDKNTAPKKLENYSEHDKQNEYTDRTSEPTTEDDFLSVTTSENILDLIATRGFWNTMLSLFYSYGQGYQELNGDSEDMEDKNSDPGKDIVVRQGETKLNKLEEDEEKVYPKKLGDSEHSINGEVENGSNLHNITFEDLLQLVGTRGRWNVLLFVLCAYASFVSPMQTLSYQFLGATPDYWCRVDSLLDAGWTQEQILSFAIPIKEEGKHESCLMYDHNYTHAVALGYEQAIGTLHNTSDIIPCYARDFNRSQHQSTMTTEWDLVCERRVLYSTTQAAAQIGKFVGAFLLGYLMDLYGRRKIVLWCSLLSFLSAFGSALSPVVEVYILLKIVIMAVMAGIYLGCITLLMETSGRRERTRTSALFVIPWALGYMLLPGIAYLVRPWKWLQVAVSLPTLLLVLYYWFLPESPRWLILQGRHHEALEVLTSAAKINKKTLPSDEKLLAAMEQLQKKASAEKETILSDVKSNTKRIPWDSVRRVLDVVKEYLAVMTVRELRGRALIVFYCWFASALVYYGISLNATNISADPYLYIFLGGLLELPSYLLLWPLMVCLGRVKSLALLYLVCAITILILSTLIYLYPAAPIGLLMFLSLSGKVAITMGFHLIWLFTLELFPTKYRSLATSQASVCARVGSVSSPYLNDVLGELVTWAPSAVFSILSLIAAVLSIILPETKGRTLSEENNMEKRAGKDNLGFVRDTDHQTRLKKTTEADDGESATKENVTTSI
ncbi:LOW QUALITY PROTEIN: organic cation transporter protein-like [Portunus trituberculatus]|uniref:LOW QUALITY PROTEIN: organic cation transporter protein-like n=1 Tax=Portunus trituberculatus TaxID=210409 RepID=UPI001E1CF847|nr:LOW QUALITY PROTEIN: organic cation transporter protein-like [Portunus trituberculatus]